MKDLINGLIGGQIAGIYGLVNGSWLLYLIGLEIGVILGLVLEIGNILVFKNANRR